MLYFHFADLPNMERPYGYLERLNKASKCLIYNPFAIRVENNCENCNQHDRDNNRDQRPTEEAEQPSEDTSRCPEKPSFPK
jgi:hypothetical protein